jgi:hypothetical protein
MAELEIEIQLVDERTAVAETTVDYVPFGLKVLKLQVRKLAGPSRNVWLRPANFRRDEDVHAIYGYADDGHDLQVVWGAGDVMGFSANYREQAGTKRAVALDDDDAHFVYLHLFHRPVQPETHLLRDRQLTIVAVTSGDDEDRRVATSGGERRRQERVVASKTFTLTVPSGADDPARALWSRHPDGRGSTITFIGRDAPAYVSRWWPSRRVAYRPVEALPPITLAYERLVKNREGAIDASLEAASGPVPLARVGGHLTLPLHDLRWFVPELYRFYGDRHYALRLTFFWYDEHIDAADLLSFVPEGQRPGLLAQAEAEAARLMGTGLAGAWLGWRRMYEIPDVERFDIIFNPDSPALKYVCSDGHWREFWTRVDRGDAARCAIGAPKDAFRTVVNHFMRHFHFIGKTTPQSVANPLIEGRIAEVITDGRYRFDADSGALLSGDPSGRRQHRAPGLLGKNAPSIANGHLLEGGLSSDVLFG